MFPIRIPIIAFILWSLPFEIHGHEDGAPCSAVESMVPKHGKSQNDTSPFLLRIIHATKDEIVMPCYQNNKPIRGEDSLYYLNLHANLLTPRRPNLLARSNQGLRLGISGTEVIIRVA